MITNVFARVSFWASLLLLSNILPVKELRSSDELPRVFILQPSDLIEAKKEIQSQNPSLLPAFSKLEGEAERALRAGTLSVTDKKLLPPSGDKHDYMSMAPYWWPNPHSLDGLPYVQRDGEINPEREKISDRSKLDQLVQNVKVLALAYFLGEREKYGAAAASLLRVWFLDEKTKMNPNLKFAQAVPGRNQGRAAGIIETHDLPELIDAVGLLTRSRGWSAKDQAALEKWFEAYLNWLLETPEGQEEAKAQNNHASWYDVQVASFGLFIGKRDVAKRIFAEFPLKRIAKQIEPDGRQPRELARTESWNYSLFNLEALFDAASMAEKVGVNLWNYETPDKRSIRKALEWLMPFATGERKWNNRQLSRLRPERLAPLLRRASVRYGDGDYEKVINKISEPLSDQRWQLLYPTQRVIK